MFESLNFGVLRSLAIYYGIPGRQARMRRFYSAFVQEGDLCFDIGSHVGNRIKAFTGLGARVVAVEPQPLFFDLLKQWYGKNPKVELVPHGIAASAGTMDMHISSRTPTVSTFSRAWIDDVQKGLMWQTTRWDQIVQVPVETLDDLIERFGMPAFCKIDVEGFETEVLRGLSKPLPALSFEFIPISVERALECIDRLMELGDYEFNWSAVETMRWKEDQWISADLMKAQLSAMPREGRSGDVYARIRPYKH